MILSEAELGISDSHDGIIELAANTPIGLPLQDHLGDTILDIHIWPNRPDMMSMIGIAREVSAIQSSKLKLPTINVVKDDYKIFYFSNWDYLVLLYN